MINRIFGRSSLLFTKDTTPNQPQPSDQLVNAQSKQLGLELEEVLLELEIRYRNRNQTHKILLTHRLGPVELKSIQGKAAQPSFDEFDFEIDVRWI